MQKCSLLSLRAHCVFAKTTNSNSCMNCQIIHRWLTSLKLGNWLVSEYKMPGCDDKELCFAEARTKTQIMTCDIDNSNESPNHLIYNL